MEIAGMITGKYFTGYEVQRTEKRYSGKSFASHIMPSANQSLDSSSIKNIETERYTIEKKDGGCLRIYDKERKEGFNWKLKENQIQMDKETGKKFLINDWGSGFFNMLAVDDELEKGIKEALGVDELETRELTGFTVHKDENTGVHYITANGYESRGGLILLDEQAKQKLNSLAQEYLDKYPKLVKTGYNCTNKSECIRRRLK